MEKEKRAYPAAGGGFRWNICLFHLFYGVVLQIIVGAPVIIYAKALGASSTIIGILVSLAPLISLIELRVVKLIPLVGYKKLALFGMGFATLSAFTIALTTVMYSGALWMRLLVLGICLCIFNVFRYTAVAAFTPWVTALIPRNVLGVFVSWNRLFERLGNFAALVGSAGVVVWGTTMDWGFALIFGIAVINGMLSFFFMARMCDVKSLQVLERSSQVFSKKTLLASQPFVSLAVLNLTMVSITGSLGVYVIDYLRETPALGDRVILYLAALKFVAMSFLPWFGRLADRVGSKPVMRFAILLYCLVLLVWFLVASKVMPCNLWVIGSLIFTAGVAQSNYVMANMRLLMATTPEVGRNQFLAGFSSIVAVGLCIALIGWGVMLDWFRNLDVNIDGIYLHRHSYYFLGLFILAMVSLRMLRAVRDVRSEDVKTEVNDSNFACYQ